MAIPQNAQGADPLLDLKSSFYHTNFKIDSDGENLYLSSDNGNILDSLLLGAIPENLSFGRTPDGGPDWFLFETPTLELPMTASAIRIQVQSLNFLTPGGFRMHHLI